MAKVMLFIDGTWLYKNMPRLSEAYGQADFRIDFGKLPLVLSGEVARQLGSTSVDVVRTHLFGSYAANYDLKDDDAVQRRLDFFDMLKEEHNYELELFPINFRGRRLRRNDRDPEDSFEPKEKCVDISLATAMLYYAAIPNAYDIAICVVGDQDFKPVLQNVRKLGKRVAIASIKGSCAPEYADARDEARVKDYGIIWLDDLLEELALRYERHKLPCQSPMHKGDREVWTTFYPRRGQRFYCPDCQSEFASQKQEAQQEYVSSNVEEVKPAAEAAPAPTPGMRIPGVVKKKVADRGFGFIQTEEGLQYFFHLTDLEGDLEFQEVEEGLHVEFEIKKDPNHDKAGAAQKVRRVG
ncbi:MAG: NYN domain-containing protein [Nitrospirae bacterium]|nr:NYN domain-containing protein [Nitrospirota bacterium]MBI5694598.1 NYN domain-containing protein [Nitrospirota bacterium]